MLVSGHDDPASAPPSRRLSQLRQGRLVAYRGLQDLDDDWTETVTAAVAASQEDPLLMNSVPGSSVTIDAARSTAMRQLRLLREMRTRGLRGELDTARALRADIEGALGEPCPLPSEEWQILDEDGAPAGAVLDLDLKPSSGTREAVVPRGLPTLLRPGMRFAGHQCCNRFGSNADDWQVSVRIEECDWNTGYICGCMTAENVPRTVSPVSTFFEGNIVGLGHHTFLTEEWGADKASDWAHWQKFPSFQRMQQQLARRSAAASDDGAEGAAAPRSPLPPLDDVVYMRWKEKSFERDGANCGLTIAGFYYACLSLDTGAIEGFYFDSASQPFQQLHLQATRVGGRGFSSTAYQFH